MMTLSGSEISELKEWFAEINDLLKYIMKWSERYLQVIDTTSNEKRVQFVKKIHHHAQVSFELNLQCAAQLNDQSTPIDVRDMLFEIRSSMVAVPTYVKILSHSKLGEPNEIERKFIAKLEGYSKLLSMLNQEAEPFMKVFDRWHNSYPASS